MKNIFSALAVGLLLISCGQSAPLLRTTVAQGEIEGVQEDGYVVYKNIPYAEAPIGDLRWKAPVPKQPWDTVYKADRWGNRPPQPIDPNQGGAGLAMSEDCLYLCVGTPAKSAKEKLPVFVMIHGGGFLTGSYAGVQANYIKEGIVYCSIEYRLGALGFMAHPELAAESDYGKSGNYGLMDQVCALRWIHDNIAAFGGDPDKITIAGESAGAISVAMHCASPECKGLFRAAISESGGSMWPVAESRQGNTAIMTSEASEAGGLMMQEALGAADLAEMRKAPWQDIQANNTQMESFWPVADGKYIIGDAYREYEAGRFNDVDILVGFNSDEGALFCRPLPVADYENMVRANYGGWADRFLDMYPATDETTAYYALSDIFRDGSFGWPTYAWANLQSRIGKSRVFMYYFDQDSENTIFRSPRGGAIHVAEMPFAYGWSFGDKTFAPEEEPIRDAMISYWINFTKTGDPNGVGLPLWKRYNEADKATMHIRNGFELIPMPNLPQLSLFEEFFAAKRTEK